MAYQATFKRYELKYLLTRQEKQNVLKSMAEHMKLDDYGQTTIPKYLFRYRHIPADSSFFGKPVYKEKLRVRSYQPAGPDDPVFVELKKKYKSVVYKRRLVLPEAQVMKCFEHGKPLPIHSQIGEEIAYFWDYYETLHPTVFLTYEREAYYALDGSDFRVTFDENILYREEDISLGSKIYGTPILGENQTLMEIKTSGGIPLWMSETLTKNTLFKTSFSKYGTAYQQMMDEKVQRGVQYA